MLIGDTRPLLVQFMLNYEPGLDKVGWDRLPLPPAFYFPMDELISPLLPGFSCGVAILFEGLG
ncbi:hypothetical protein BST81_04210 [Leptolyngbya sp. 'hensonii']|nr:hypothetical protein BST81_04210 [Leptolyngbya sp. 'hensonii']